MNQRASIIALVVGLAAGLLSFFLLFQKTSEIDKKTTPIEILVASRYIPAGNILTVDMVQKKSIPESYVSPSAIQNVKEVSNLLTLVPISAGEQILSNKFGYSGNSLALNLNNGLRAYTLEVNETSGVSDLIHPGNHVDIMTKITSNKRQITSFVFQNIEVLATGQKLAQNEQKNSTSLESYSTVTLAVTPEQAETLMYLDGQPIRLLLRGPNDDEVISISAKSDSEVLSKIGHFTASNKANPEKEK
ncbi:MAG TPA: Flp pilus assembly protein CpaB [bacterium]|jgi:pilus assembly protein CpaB|nr:Flp pilus assembly protein CpaB [bacterium]